MMKSLSYLIMLLCGLGLGQNLLSQDIKVDLKMINQAYLQAKTFEQEMEISLFSSEDTEQAIETSTSFIRRKGQSFYVKNGEQERISNERLTLVIDHSSKSILLQGPPVNKEVMFMDVKLDSMLNICSDIQYESTQGGMGTKILSMKKCDSALTKKED